VTDPTHPLFGRRFQVLSVSHPPQAPGHVVVAYRDGMRLCLPVLATDLAPDNLPLLRTKVTPEALRGLLALVKECEGPCPDHPGASGTDSPTP
jgi:hypothetical protein